MNTRSVCDTCLHVHDELEECEEEDEEGEGGEGVVAPGRRDVPPHSWR